MSKFLMVSAKYRLSSLYTSLLDTWRIPKSTTDTRNKRISLMDSQHGV